MTNLLRRILGPYVSMDDVLAIVPDFHTYVDGVEANMMRESESISTLEKEALSKLESVNNRRKVVKRRLSAVTTIRRSSR